MERQRIQSEAGRGERLRRAGLSCLHTETTGGFKKLGIYFRSVGKALTAVNSE